jgi:hypothetical protein
MQQILDYCKDGHAIVFDDDNKTITYKSVTILAHIVSEAFNSEFDKVQLAKNLFCVKRDDLVEFGCLTMTIAKFKDLKSQVFLILKKKRKNGKE